MGKMLGRETLNLKLAGSMPVHIRIYIILPFPFLFFTLLLLLFAVLSFVCEVQFFHLFAKCSFVTVSKMVRGLEIQQE